MENWKISKAQDLQVTRSRQRRGLVGLFCATVSSTAIADILLVRAPIFESETDLSMTTFHPAGCQQHVRLPGEIRGYATGAETRNGTGTLGFMPCSRPHMEFTRTNDALINYYDAFVNYCDAFMNS